MRFTPRFLAVLCFMLISAICLLSCAMSTQGAMIYAREHFMHGDYLLQLTTDTKQQGIFERILLTNPSQVGPGGRFRCLRVLFVNCLLDARCCFNLFVAQCTRNYVALGARPSSSAKAGGPGQTIPFITARLCMVRHCRAEGNRVVLTWVL